jgi:hypothetical protein
MAQLRQDCRSPQRICISLRERRGKFEQLERLLGLAKRFCCSSRGDESLALFVGLALCFVLLCGFLPLSQRVFVRTALKSLRLERRLKSSWMGSGVLR